MPDVVGTDSLQQYAMDALTPLTWTASPTEALLPNEQLAYQHSEASLEPFRLFLSAAAMEGKLPETRLNALRSHDSILAPLRAAAEDCKAFQSISSSVVLLDLAWSPVGSEVFLPAGSLKARVRSYIIW